MDPARCLTEVPDDLRSVIEHHVTYRDLVTQRGPQAPDAHRSAAGKALVVALTILLGVTVTGPNALAAAASTPAVTATEDYPPQLAAYYAQKLVWEPCEGGLQCAWLTVPLDYSDPAGTQIQIRVNKATARGAADQRQGSIVINPGGPGGSGLDFTAYTAHSIAPKLNAAFDIVGFDPRGVGQSTPITCVTGKQTTALLETDGTPTTAVQRKHLMTISSIVGRGCVTMSPTLASHVGTDDAVRDMDVLRAALGESMLNWLGWSYGTVLGTRYTEAFPDRVGRFVLDGALDPSRDMMEVSRGQSRGFQVAMTRFAADCATRATCAYKGGTKKVLAGINTLLARLDTRPLPTNDPKRKLTQTTALSGLFQAMYAKWLWPTLRTALRQTNRNDGSLLMALADVSSDRTGPNTYAGNTMSAFYAINCWDAPPPPGEKGLAAAATAWSRGAPVPEMAKSMSWGNAPCTTWFGHSTRAPAPASSTTSAPILVVGTLYDPATPYPWAVALSKQLPTSTLLTYNGDGHTAYGSGSACINKAVETYLLTGTPPAAGLVCT
jgi:pimeloyl-ACP methyl ester carboxylesterase